MQALFEALREACSPRIWSRGVELHRADAVDATSLGDPAELRVRTPGKTVAPQVTLHIADAEWSCSCAGDDDPCEHVVAATLAIRQAKKEGRSLATSDRAGADIGYRLGRDGDRIVVARVAVRAGEETPIEGTLGGLLSGREAGPPIEPTAVDLTIDQFLQQSRVRSLPAERVVTLLPLLAQAKDVRLEGRPIAVTDAPHWPRVSLLRAGRGFALRFERSPAHVELVAPGLVLRDGGTLAPIGAPETVGLRLERLPCEQRFEGAALAELVTRVVPMWRERTEVVEHAKLPEVSGEIRARAVLDVVQRGSTLHVVASIGYGEPPVARVVGDRLEKLKGATVPVIERDLREERRVAERLRTTFDLVPGRALDLTGRDAVTMAARLRAAEGVTIFGDAHEVHYPVELSAELAVDDGRLAVRFRGTAAGDAREVDGAAALQAWRDGLDAVPLLGGGWAPLPLDWLARHGHHVRELLAARDAGGKVARHSLPALARLCADLDHPAPLELRQLEPLARSFDGLPAARLPDELRADLRPYQRRGVDWLAFLRSAELGALLADDMGLGKTLQTICVLEGRALVVCPRSVVHNWVDEIRRFRPGLAVTVYHGAERELPERGVVVTTYALLRRDVAGLAAVDWDVAVLDEAQAIKNPDSQVAEAAHRLRAGFRIALSGTPVENRLEELWSLMHFCNPGLLGGRGGFRDAYERPIAEGDALAAARLRERIRPFLLRRTKAVVATDLPPRVEALLTCELEPDERAVYDAVLAATRASVVAELERGGSVIQVLEALLRLRQAACDVALVPGQGSRAEPSSKIQRLMLALEDAATEGHKALVFSQWTSLLDRVEAELRRAGIAFARLDGATRDRKAVVDAFQAADGPPVMLLSLKAGGTGLNLTAADHVFLLDPWWNPAAEDQAADRAHRIGQRRSVLVHRLIAKDTVEERILELQAKKRGLAEAALDEASTAAALTRDDLLALFA
ncbi:MAG: DEAD/DEAH box helicase [Deltaproteobacteria bacterium]|nr:DEAD/DEAH box helicase [Deltaproteobacteria bacterium]